MCEPTDQINKLSEQLGILDLQLAERRAIQRKLDYDLEVARKRIGQLHSSTSDEVVAFSASSRQLQYLVARRSAAQDSCAQRTVRFSEQDVRLHR
jgi:hypothetical protein